MKPTKRSVRNFDHEIGQIVSDAQRIARRLSRLAGGNKGGWSLLRVSDEFAAIARAAERAKWRSYDLYMVLGRREIKQHKVERP